MFALVVSLPSCSGTCLFSSVQRPSESTAGSEPLHHAFVEFILGWTAFAFFDFLET